MLDYQRILDDVHTRSTAPAARRSICSLAAGEDRSACEEVNERLRRCVSFLRRGSRSEAIQLAEIEPVLLDVVAMLDFPDRQQWCDLLAEHGITPGPPLALDLAAELNEAYVHERPLAGLLEQHRLLALARSPLRARIQVLRQLADLDMQNPVWREDLSAYEREPRQLHKEVTAASEAGNLAVLTTLDENCAATLGWNRRRKACSRERPKRGRGSYDIRPGRKLAQLAAALDQAHCQLDLAEGRQLRRAGRPQRRSCV